MGRPTEVEKISLEDMTRLAERLESGQASDADVRRALGMVLKMFVAERMLGLTSVPEFERHIRDCPARKNYIETQQNRLLTWPVAATVITIILSAVGLILKFC